MKTYVCDDKNGVALYDGDEVICYAGTELIFGSVSNINGYNHFVTVESHDGKRSFYNYEIEKVVEER